MSLKTTNPAWTDLSVPDFLHLANARLSSVPSELIFDPGLGHALREGDVGDDPDLAEDLMIGRPLRRAAVLVPVVAHAAPTVLLTQRTEHLPSHAGQIAFPGGRIDAGDADAKSAALREAHEEIGLDARFIEPLGYLDGYRTGTGFHVTPLVALIRTGFSLRLAEGEVADTFEVPLRFLMTGTNHQRHERAWRGRTRSYWAMPFGERYIWGATAGMLKNLHDRLFAS